MEVKIKRLNENKIEISALLEMPTKENRFVCGLNDMGFFHNVLLPDSKIDVDLILNICKHDNKKYPRLVEALLYINEDKLALKLEPNVIDMCYLSRCDPSKPYKNELSFLKDENDFNKGYEINEKCTLEWKHLSQSNTADELYFMDRSAEYFGFCLLINNYFTKGTYIEMQKLRNIFYQLNYNVIMEKNLKAKEIEQKLTEISKDKRLKNHSAFIFMIITHGNANGQIYGFDGLPLEIDSLVSILKNDNCEDLKGKPKIFFFNACRSDESIKLDIGYPIADIFKIIEECYKPVLDHSESVEEKMDQSGEESCVSDNEQMQLPRHTQSSSTIRKKEMTSAETDYLVCYTTMLGYPSFVHRVSGTTFGSTLIEFLIKRSHRNDLDKILKRMLSKLNRATRYPLTKSQIEEMIRNSTDIELTLCELQRYNFRVFPYGPMGGLPKHLYFNFKDKRSFVERN